MSFWRRKCNSTARLEGKTAIVTGANTGIGYETAKDLYKRGARVIMACRNLERAQTALEKIKEECKGLENLGKLVIIELNLSSLKSVRECASKLLQQEKRIDLLINNAAIVCAQETTEDGFEMQFATNYLGPFLFTLLLLPKMRKSTPARIVNIASNAYIVAGRIQLDDLNWKTRSYSVTAAYSQTKLANILFSKELSKRLKKANIEGINTYSLHPGVIHTEIGRNLTGFWRVLLNYFVVPFIATTPEKGAQTTIYCAVDEQCEKETGLFYSNCNSVRVFNNADNDEDSEQLWEESIKMVQLQNIDLFKE